MKAVHLVVYDNDSQSVQAFQTELKKRGGVGPPPQQSPAGIKRRRGLRSGSTKRPYIDTPHADVDVTSEEKPVILDPLQPEIGIGNVVVQAKSGNITKEVTDAIATQSNSELDVALRKTSPVTIVKIERVQHPGLYRQYMVRRDQMEHKSSSNEKLLFHGTAGASLPTVSKHGFKRNYCDKNGNDIDKVDCY